jgi:hypothetical protein
MSIIGKLLKTTIDIVTLPVDVVKDVATIGGALTDEDVPYTAQKFQKLSNDIKEVSNEADKL